MMVLKNSRSKVNSWLNQKWKGCLRSLLYHNEFFLFNCLFHFGPCYSVYKLYCSLACQQSSTDQIIIEFYSNKSKQTVKLVCWTATMRCGKFLSLIWVLPMSILFHFISSNITSKLRCFMNVYLIVYLALLQWNVQWISF